MISEQHQIFSTKFYSSPAGFCTVNNHTCALEGDDKQCALYMLMHTRELHDAFVCERLKSNVGSVWKCAQHILNVDATNFHIKRENVHHSQAAQELMRRHQQLRWSNLWPRATSQSARDDCIFFLGIRWILVRQLACQIGMSVCVCVCVRLRHDDFSNM